MGRKKLQPGERLTVRIYSSFTKSESKAIKAVAKRKKVLPSRFVRDVALDAVKT